MNVFLIVTKYRDGEIRTIEGYVSSEKRAKKKSGKLNSTNGDECFYYDYLIISKCL